MEMLTAYPWGLGFPVALGYPGTKDEVGQPGVPNQWTKGLLMISLTCKLKESKFCLRSL